MFQRLLFPPLSDTRVKVLELSMFVVFVIMDYYNWMLVCYLQCVRLKN